MTATVGKITRALVAILTDEELGAWHFRVRPNNALGFIEIHLTAEIGNIVFNETGAIGFYDITYARHLDGVINVRLESMAAEMRKTIGETASLAKTSSPA